MGKTETKKGETTPEKVVEDKKDDTKKRKAEEQEDGEGAKLIEEIAEKLKEENTELVRIIVEDLGVKECKSLLEETLKLEEGEGIKTADNERRKTPGGVFFHLAREKMGKTKFNRKSKLAHIKKPKKQEKEQTETTPTEETSKDDE